MEYKDNAILHVDLTARTTRTEAMGELRRMYIGGAGINAKLLYDRVTPEIDALSPNNCLIFGAGFLVGTGFVAGARMTITSKSPMSGIFADSNAGGHFGAKMRQTGYDHIVMTGKASTPVYLLLDGQEAPAIISGEDIWGLDVEETNRVLKEKYPNCDVACIGPAGENLVRYSCIIVSGHHAAGRTGLGCVMGSKNLKAIVVRGKKPLPVFDPCAFDDQKKKFAAVMADLQQSDNGSLFLVNVYNSRGWLTCENGQRGQAPEVQNLYIDQFKQKYQSGKLSCFGCPIACQKRYEVPDGKYASSSQKIDFGSVAYLGPNIGVYQYDAVLYLDRMASNFGMDTMELGAVIGLTMECRQRGIIDDRAVDGLDLRWGNVDAVMELIEKIARREGFGTVLADGVKVAGERLHAEKYAFNVKGIGCAPMSKKRNDWALGYMTSTRGGDHLKAFPFSTMFGPQSKQFARRIFHSKGAVNPEIEDESGRVVWWHENYKCAIDSLGLCIFAFYAVALAGRMLYDDIALVMAAVTGIKTDATELFYATERIYQIEKAFNVKHGVTSRDDVPPVRKEEEDIDEAYVNDISVDYRHPGMRQEYYNYRGYTKDGLPTRQRLHDVGLDSVSVDLAQYLSEEPTLSLQEALQTVNINL